MNLFYVIMGSLVIGFWIGWYSCQRSLVKRVKRAMYSKQFKREVLDLIERG